MGEVILFEGENMIPNGLSETLGSAGLSKQKVWFESEGNDVTVQIEVLRFNEEKPFDIEIMNDRNARYRITIEKIEE